MNQNVIITCPVTGAGDTLQRHPDVPVTPEQIANAAIEAAQAGAAIAHVHVRDPQTGAHSHDVELFREVAERVRSAETDVILNFTAGGGGDWVPDPDEPGRGGPGTDMRTPEQRHAPVGELLPEMCTLDCGSYNFADSGVYVNTAEWVRRQARLIQQAGVKPEIECFDLGHVRLGRQIIDEGLVDGDPLFQLCLGIPWGAEATPDTMLAMRDRLPANAQWAAFGIGRMQMPMAAQSVLMGGHVRVGLEDNLFLRKGVLASNGQLVEKALGIVENLGARALTPAEARQQLGLREPGE